MHPCPASIIVFSSSSSLFRRRRNRHRRYHRYCYCYRIRCCYCYHIRHCCCYPVIKLKCNKKNLYYVAMEHQSLWTPILPDRKNADICIKYIFMVVIIVSVFFMTFFPRWLNHHQSGQYSAAQIKVHTLSREITLLFLRRFLISKRAN